MKKIKNKTKWLFRDALLSSLLSLVAFAALSVTMLSTSYFNPLVHTLKDFSFLDIFYQGSFEQGKKISNEIILINIEDYGRRELAELVQLINAQAPQVIGIDVIFQKNKTDAADLLLANALSRPNIVTTYIDNPDEIISNASIFKSVQQVSGFVNFDADVQTGVVRKIQAIKVDGEEKKYAFAGQIIKKYQSGKLWKANQLEDRLAKRRRIKYYGAYKDFIHFNAGEFIGLKEKSIITDKIVLLGYLGSPLGNIYDIEDKHFTPLNQNPSGKGIPDMYGLTIHANILNMILLDDFFIEFGRLGQGILIFIFAYLASLYFIWLDRKLKISYRTVRKLVLFAFAFLFVGLCVRLFNLNLVVEPTLLIMTTIFSAGFVKYYKHLVRYIKTKRKFKSYIK